MKKKIKIKKSGLIIYYLIFITLFLNCSSNNGIEDTDDSLNVSGDVKVTINGENKTFKGQVKYLNGVLAISGAIVSTKPEAFLIVIDASTPKTGIFEFTPNQSTFPMASYVINPNGSGQVQYSTFTDTTTNILGKITITKWDTSKNVVSGTFNFVGYNQSNFNDKVTLTNGSFTDLKIE